MMMKIASCLVVALLLVGEATAHKSLRHRVRMTEEERHELHLLNRAAKVKTYDPHSGDDHYHRDGYVHGDGEEKRTRLYKSEAYHFQWGPEYPVHDQTELQEDNDERFHEGESIPDFISDQEFVENFA